MTVHQIKNMNEYKNAITKGNCVIDFFAVWCGPCKAFAPTFHSYADTTKGVHFYQVDVDECEDIASHCGVRAMPTFQFYSNGARVNELTGANKDKFHAILKDLRWIQ